MIEIAEHALEFLDDKEAAFELAKRELIGRNIQAMTTQLL